MAVVPGMVSVVVPAFNEEASISACLDALLNQSYPDIEILVLDGGSTDRTVEVVADYTSRDARVRLIDNPRRTQPAALNSAIPVACGEYIIRMDAHATVGPNYVAGIVGHLSTGKWGGVGGRKNAVGYTAAGRAIAAALGSRFGVGNSTYHHGVSVQSVEHIPFGAYPGWLVRELGGWDEACPTNEDFEFDYRVRQRGLDLLFDPALVIEWEGRQSIRALGRQYRRYGRGKSLVVRKHPRSASLRHLAPPGIVISLIAAAALAPFRPKWAALLAAPYLGLLTVGSLSVAARLNTAEERLTAPLALAAMHLPWGLGFLEGLAGASQEQGPR